MTKESLLAPRNDGGEVTRASGRRAAAREEAPHRQHDDGPDHGTDQAGALIGAVPAERLAEIGRDEGAGDAERRGEDEARRLVGAGVQEFRDDAGNEADDDKPENTHRPPPENVRARNAEGGTLVPCWLLAFQLVMRGHSRSKNGVLSHAYDPASRV